MIAKKQMKKPIQKTDSIISPVLSSVGPGVTTGYRVTDRSTLPATRS